MEEDIINKIKIENLVLPIDFGVKMDLDLINREFENSEYSPEEFPGLVYRMKDPKATFLIFSSGKVNCTGIPTLKLAKQVIALLSEKFKTIGLDVKEPKFKIKNIVASMDLGKKVDLSKILKLDNVEFEPAEFPGVIYRAKEYGIVFLTFSSGKVIISGASNVKDVKNSASHFISELKRINAI